MDEVWQVIGVIAVALFVIFVFAASVGSIQNTAAINELQRQVLELQKAAK